MHYKVLLLIILYIYYPKPIEAQESIIELLDSRTDHPVESANICWQSLGEVREVGHSITDFRGKASITGQNGKKVTITISCIGYKTLTDTIMLEAFTQMKLEEDIFNIEQIVVSGDAIPVVTGKSIYRVKVITPQKIEKMGAVTLEQALFNEPNIKITTDLVLGSKIEMMGLDGYNIKIMVNGVPIIGRLDGNIDLSQVNITNVDHIEVIEGPMSVVYGNNAMAGTINIITKKDVTHQLHTRIGVQAESVGEYSSDFFVSSKTKFGMFSVDGGIINFDGVDFDKTTRSIDWKPKTQAVGNIGYNHQKNNWELNARLSAFYGTLLFKGDQVDGYNNKSEQIVFANDERYYTQRYDASASLKNNINANNYFKLLAAYNYFDRSLRLETINLATLEKDLGKKESSQDNQQYMLRGVYNGKLPNLKLELQIGGDFNVEHMGGPRMQKGDKSIGDHAMFINLKYALLSKIELQPGYRLTYNTSYKENSTYAINLKWDIAPQIDWRASIAKAYRAPSLKELYYQYIDSNHDVNGNPDLMPETSGSYNTSIIVNTPFGKHSIRSSISAYYNNVNNKIELVQDENASSYSYKNIVHYESVGSNVGLKYALGKSVIVSGGYCITGRYNGFEKQKKSTKFFYSNDILATLQINEPISKVNVFVDYKNKGKQPYLFSTTNNNGEETILEGQQESYQILNASISRKFHENRLNITLMVKNVFDVNSVKITEGSNNGLHSTGANSTPLLYGRSFLIKLSYNFIK